MTLADRLMMTAQAAGIPKAANLKIWVPCDGGTTDLARGASFTINGSPAPTLSPGVFGNATLFDANTEFINLGDLQAIFNTGTGNFTLSAWFKRPTLGGQQHHAILELDAAGFTKRELAFYTDVHENNTGVCAMAWFSGGTYNLVYENAASTHDLNWHHLVAVKSGSTGFLYVDNVNRPSSQFNDWSKPKNSYSQNAIIGARPANNTASELHIQHFMFWNAALDAADVNDLYNATIGGTLAL